MVCNGSFNYNLLKQTGQEVANKGQGAYCCVLTCPLPLLTRPLPYLSEMKSEIQGRKNRSTLWLPNKIFP